MTARPGGRLVDGVAWTARPLPQGPAVSRCVALWAKVLAAILAVVFLLVLLVIFFPWDWLRGPLNRYVTDQVGPALRALDH